MSSEASYCETNPGSESLMAEDRAGELIEFGPVNQLFSSPTDQRTEDYVNGRFG